MVYGMVRWSMATRGWTGYRDGINSSFISIFGLVDSPIYTMSRPSSTSTHLQVNPTVPPAIHSLANPKPAQLDAHLQNYLLPNVLALLRDSANHVLTKKTAREQALREEGLIPGKGKGKATREEEELALDNEVHKRIERIGLMVGGYIAEKCVAGGRG